MAMAKTRCCISVFADRAEELGNPGLAAAIRRRGRRRAHSDPRSEGDRFEVIPSVDFGFGDGYSDNFLEDLGGRGVPDRYEDADETRIYRGVPVAWGSYGDGAVEYSRGKEPTF